MTNEHEMILEKVKDAHERCESAVQSRTYARRDLANAIREANALGLSYREIADSLGLSKTGISSIVVRSK